MSNETVWAWLQTRGKIFKVFSNPEKGTIEVRNENGETLIRKTNLSRRQVELIEKNFLAPIAKKINGNNTNNEKSVTPLKKQKDSFDPMIA